MPSAEGGSATSAPALSTSASPSNKPEQERSAFVEWLENLFEEYLNIADYWREREYLLREPERIGRPAAAGGPQRGPIHFAHQGVISIVVFLAAMGNLLPILFGPPRFDAASQRQRTAQEVRVLRRAARNATTPAELKAFQARIKKTENRGNERAAVSTLLNQMAQGVKFFFLLAFIVQATLLRRYLLPHQAELPEAARVDRFYLYYVPAKWLPGAAVTITGLFLLMVWHDYAALAPLHRLPPLLALNSVLWGTAAISLLASKTIARGKERQQRETRTAVLARLCAGEWQGIEEEQRTREQIIEKAVNQTQLVSVIVLGIGAFVFGLAWAVYDDLVGW